MKRQRGSIHAGVSPASVRATRGTRPLPLDPLPSSLCSVVEDRMFVTLTLTHNHFKSTEERKSPWRENGSGNPCPTLEAELARRPFVDEGSPTMNQVMSVTNPRISG